jgi:hypothetical protein
MAKVKSIISLQGTLHGVTYVKSKRYGDHARAKRGTHVKAEMNDICQEESAQLIQTNLPGQLIHGPLEQYRQNFKGGQCWQRLLSVLKAHYKNKGVYDYKVLENFEVYKEYPFQQFMDLRAEVSVTGKPSGLKVVLNYSDHPIFEKAKYIDGYCLTVIAIYPDLAKGKTSAAAVSSPVISLKSKIKKQSFTISFPRRAPVFVICVKLEGTEGGKTTPGYVTKGMRIVKVGALRKAKQLTNSKG